MLSRLFLASLVAVAFSQPVFAAEDGSPAVNQALPAAVNTVLERRDLPPDSISVMVIDIDSGETILAHHPDEARNPASVMKLVTTLVSLDILGPAFQWKTEAWPQGPMNDGALEGDLLLKGYGDPFLVTERVWQMARSLRA